MLTKNWFKIMASAFKNQYWTSDNITNTFGKIAQANFYNGVQHRMLFEAMVKKGDYNEPGVKFMNGSTAPTPDDYSISGKPCDVSVSFPSRVSMSDDNLGISFTATYGVTAINETTISDIFMNVMGSTPTGNMEVCLADHTKLDQSITLQPGESKQITYTIRFNYPGT